MRFLSGGFVRNKGVFFLQKSDEIEQLVGVDDVRGALHAAGAELRVAQPVAGERLIADLAQGVASGGDLPVIRWRRLVSGEGGHASSCRLRGISCCRRR